MKQQLLFIFSFLFYSLWGFSQAVVTTDTSDNTYIMTSPLVTSSTTNPNGVITTNASYTQLRANAVNVDDLNAKFEFDVQTSSGSVSGNLTFDLRKIVGTIAVVKVTVGAQAPQTFTYDGGTGTAGSYVLSVVSLTGTTTFSTTPTHITFEITDLDHGTATAVPAARLYNFKVINKTLPLTSEAVLGSGNIWYHNYSPDQFDAATLGSSGTLLEQGTAVATPTTNDNSSANVAKFTKDANISSFIRFQMPGAITSSNQATAIFKIRMYIPSTNVPGSSGSKISMILRDGANTGATQIILNKIVTAFDKWQEYTFDFTGSTLATPSYENVLLLFDNPDTDLLATGSVYYFDAFQGPQGSTLATNSFTLASFQVYPNPTADSFTINTEQVVKSVALYNVSGQLVKTFGSSESYDITDLNAGIYFATVTSESDSQTIKIVKK
jgi:hypothetical protein